MTGRHANGTVADLAAVQAQVAGQVAAYLTAKDAGVIPPALLASGLTGSGPIPDGTVLPPDPIGATAAGRYNRRYFRFDWAQEPAPWNAVDGAAHAFDLPFLFGNFGPSLFANATNSSANRPGRLALSAAMMASLGAFARQGNPNHPALGVTWPAWPGRIVFDATPGEARIRTE